MKHKIHIFGASGSGTTTISKVISGKLGYSHFDVDDYFWMRTENPYAVERSVDERQLLIQNELLSCDKWILSGSLCGWGDMFIEYFDLVVFVYVPRGIRLERLRKREFERYGDKILDGGERYDASKEFIDWAAAYDEGTRNGRSLPMHEKWLKTISCPIVRIVNDALLDDSVNRVLSAILDGDLPPAAAS